MLNLHNILAWLPNSSIANPQAVVDSGLVCLSVSTDSRNIPEKALFIALKGDSFDAHDYLAQVADKGACAALVSRSWLNQQTDLIQFNMMALIAVDDTLLALQTLAKAHRAQFELPLAVVVGSNGKTSVTQMIRSIFQCHSDSLAKPNAAHSTDGNFNNHIGLPLTLLKLKKHHLYSVVELGMNHPGETALLAPIAAPTIALINNAQREHQEFMHTVEAVAHEHGAVLKTLPTNGIAVIPAYDEYAALWRGVAGARKIIDFALETDSTEPSNAVVKGRLIAVTPAQKIAITTPVGSFEVTLQIAGEHQARNALAACAVGLAAGVPLASIAQGLSSFTPAKGRMQEHLLHMDGARVRIIDDSYNANPDSVDAAIRVLANTGKNSMLILGDMGEVGEQGSMFHTLAGEHAARAGVGQLYTVGSLSRYSNTAFLASIRWAQHFESHELLAQFLSQLKFDDGAVVLIKGSRFMTMEKALNVLVSRNDSSKLALAGK